ncbi:MAG: hypothetical protein AAF488_15980 [Planctomycetota bacterium]
MNVATLLPVMLLSIGVGWLALRIVRAILSRGPRCFAVARAVVDGGCRQRVVVVMLGGAIFYLALLAGILSGDVLVHRVQNLLTYGLGGVLLLALVLTAILGCGSLASEFEEKQIYTVTTKPIGRGSFLLGKWIGVLSINLVLLGVAGLEVHALTTLQVWGVDDPAEVERVQREVLTARIAIAPNDENDPALRARFDGYLPEYAKKNPARYQALGDEGFRDYAWNRFLEERRRIGPGKTHIYRFDGVSSGTATLVLRGRMAIPPVGGQVPVGIAIDDDEFQRHELPLDRNYEVPLPMRAHDRKIEIRIHFLDEESESALAFDPPHGIEIVQPRSGFTWNLVRALAAYTAKLGFIAALAVFGASFLSFPVATLVVALLTVIGSSSDYLISSAREPGGTLYTRERGLDQPKATSHSHGDGSHHHHHPAEDDRSLIDRTLDQVEEWGLTMAFALRKYGEISPLTTVVEGRWVERRTMVDAFGWIGLVWTGSVGVLAVVIFRRREIARVQV